MLNKNCIQCKIKIKKSKPNSRYCSKICKLKYKKPLAKLPIQHRLNISLGMGKGNHNRREKHPKWKGGRYKTYQGYIKILNRGHHLADSRGYVSEHRFVAEEKLGRRLLEKDIVHHKNGIRDDNRPENLLVLTNSTHAQITFSILNSIIKCPKCNHEFLVKERKN